MVMLVAKVGRKIEFIAARKVVFLTFYQEARKVAFCGRTVNRLLVGVLHFILSIVQFLLHVDIFVHFITIQFGHW